MAKLNAAISWSGCTGIPIYGLGKVYSFQPTDATRAIVLAANAQIVCAPGCTLTWLPVRSIQYVGMVSSTTAAPSHGARWFGGLVQSNPDDVNGYPSDLFQLVGDDMVLDSISARGCSVFAFSLSGNRIRLINPLVNADKNTARPTSRGVLFQPGEGFRLTDGRICTSETALTISQFIIGGAEISDCSIDGTRLEALPSQITASDMILISSNAGPIHDIRLNAITCIGANGPGGAVRIENLSNGTVANLSLRSFVIDWRLRDPAYTAASIVMTSAYSPSPTMSNIRLDTISVIDPKGSTLVANAGGGVIDSFVWCGGDVSGKDAATAPKYAGSCIVLDFVKGGVLADLHLAAGTGGPVVSFGPTYVCENVALRDLNLSGVPSGQTAVAFASATSCGMEGGKIVGAAGALAVSMTFNSKGCYVDGADLSGIGTEPKVTLPAPTPTTFAYRLTGNYGSLQRSPVGFGAPLTVSLSGSAIAVVSSYAVVNISANASLDTINGGNSGDLLTLGVSGSGNLTVVDGAGIRLLAPCVLRVLNDTLTLVRSGDHWNEIARSMNG